jgi:glycosyltransferase involved in cell wall biosynthesis
MVSGSAIVAGKLAEGMAKNGHEVLVCTSSDFGSYYESYKQNQKVVRLRSFSNPIYHKKRFMIWPKHRIQQAVGNFGPDVIHIHEPVVSGKIGLSCSKSLNVPLIFTAHQLPWIFFAFFDFFPHAIEDYMGNAFWEYFNGFLAQCGAVIAPTATISNVISKNASRPVITISNGIDVNQFNPTPTSRNEATNLRNEFNLNPTMPVILHVGRIDRDKQVDLVVTAAAKVMEQFEVQLLVVGDGTRLDSVKRLAASYGIRERCSFPGYVDRDADLAGLYRLSSVFITASEIETQGMVLLEAAASGLPLVAVDATCIWEIVDDGVNGYLVPPKDTSAMAQKIAMLIENSDMAGKMGREGRDIAKKHSLESTIERHEMLYQDVVERMKSVTPGSLA